MQANIRSYFNFINTINSKSIDFNFVHFYYDHLFFKLPLYIINELKIAVVISKIPCLKKETLRYERCFQIHFTSRYPQLGLGFVTHYWKAFHLCFSGNWYQILMSEWHSSFPTLHYFSFIQSFSVFLSHFACFAQLNLVSNRCKCPAPLPHNSSPAFTLTPICRILIVFERQELLCARTDFWRTDSFTFRWETEPRIQGQESRFMNLWVSLAWNTWVYCWDLAWYHRMYRKRCLHLRLPWLFRSELLT